MLGSMGSMLGRRRRRRANIEPALGQRLMFAGIMQMNFQSFRGHNSIHDGDSWLDQDKNYLCFQVPGFMTVQWF